MELVKGINFSHQENKFKNILNHKQFKEKHSIGLIKCIIHVPSFCFFLYFILSFSFPHIKRSKMVAIYQSGGLGIVSMDSAFVDCES